MSKTHCFKGVYIYIYIHKAIVKGKLLLHFFSKYHICLQQIVESTNQTAVMVLS
jgi:hypothetical protein